jgi:hypothetical protein
MPCETLTHIALYMNFRSRFKRTHYVAVGVFCAVLAGDCGGRVKLTIVPAEIKRVVTEVVHTGE